MIKSKFHGGPGHPLKRDDKYNGIPEYYQEYVKMCNDRNIEPLPKLVFNRFNNKLLFNIRQEIIDEGFEWEMPLSVGNITVCKYKRKLTRRKDGTYALPVNPRKTAAVRRLDPNAKPIYYTNQHTGGYQTKIVWSRLKKSTKHLFYYSFNSCKPFRYLLFKTITDQTKRVIDKYFIFEPLHTSGEIQ
jgi:hypothetical protein